MTFHSPQGPLGSCCPDSAPSSRSQGSRGGWSRPVCSPVVQRQQSTPAASRVSEGGSMCRRGSGALCTTVARGRGQAPKETLAQQVGGTLLSLCLFTWADRSAVARAGGEWGWASLLTLGIITSRVGEGGRQDKPSRCAWPRARHPGGESQTLLQWQFGSVHPQAVGTV